MKLTTRILTLSILIGSAVQAQPLPDYTFKSPSFNGNGYSAHVLTIENQEHNRRDAIEKEIQAALDKEKNEAKNTNISKFLNNLESRIYAQISQNVATAMFADGGSNAGTLNFEGNIINWTKSSTEITLNVTDYLGSTTIISIPLGSFQF
jgi:curli production assembly/transport component CsgF